MTPCLKFGHPRRLYSLLPAAFYLQLVYPGIPLLNFCLRHHRSRFLKSPLTGPGCTSVHQYSNIPTSIAFGLVGQRLRWRKRALPYRSATPGSALIRSPPVLLVEPR